MLPKVKLMVTTATAKDFIPGYEIGKETQVYIQRMTRPDERIAIFRRENYTPLSGYKLFDSEEELREAFDLGEVYQAQK